jgi:sugar/nucleoside kinase (ribokinase family)
MRTCLGAAAELGCAEQLPAGWAAGAALVHVEGYILYKPALARDALRAARRAGALVNVVAPCSAECSTCPCAESNVCRSLNQSCHCGSRPLTHG